jgi:hypothetical protein
VLDPNGLDASVDYSIDGLGPGLWRLVWVDRSEVVFTRSRIRALMPLDRLAEVGPARLRYRTS